MRLVRAWFSGVKAFRSLGNLEITISVERLFPSIYFILLGRYLIVVVSNVCQTPLGQLDGVENLSEENFVEKLAVEPCSLPEMALTTPEPQ